MSLILSEIDRLSKVSGREKAPTLMAVSKFQSLEKIQDLYRQGQRVFGENYVQELVTKKKALEDRGVRDLEFHFIGKLQTNKVKVLLPHVRAIHSVDSQRLIEEIERRAEAAILRPEIYLQVNIDSESSKGGISVGEMDSICRFLSNCRSLIPVGLMAIPDPQKDPESAFRRMSELSERFHEILGSGLSMGMSRDYPAAIRHGATIIRMGTALFGSRE
ncbi:MAG: YggS family pyridoxal phosphate-dependent enzyme [Bdellovibrionales bacterium]|nr:YggS family pyridoxal phosphate-dependent enzyme [Bdellovibrionales bacterium]